MSGWTDNEWTDDGGDDATWAIDGGAATLEVPAGQGGAGDDRERALMHTTAMCDDSHEVQIDLSSTQPNAAGEEVLLGCIVGADSATPSTCIIVALHRQTTNDDEIRFGYRSGGATTWLSRFQVADASGTLKASLHTGTRKAYRLSAEHTYDPGTGSITNGWHAEFDAADLGGITPGDYVGIYGRLVGIEAGAFVSADNFSAATIAANPTLASYYFEDTFNYDENPLESLYEPGGSGTFLSTADEARHPADGTNQGSQLNGVVSCASADGALTVAGITFDNLTGTGTAGNTYIFQAVRWDSAAGDRYGATTFKDGDRRLSKLVGGVWTKLQSAGSGGGNGTGVLTVAGNTQEYVINGNTLSDTDSDVPDLGIFYVFSRIDSYDGGYTAITSWKWDDDADSP